ncbi:hypothetical protein AN644_05000 [Candidatus Epulonipiscium fishelsonii]|nr:hypothetical protein AN644_05000 [Epulopiscium sp. SCG-C06WGA-EpuloA1]
MYKEEIEWLTQELTCIKNSIKEMEKQRRKFQGRLKALEEKQDLINKIEFKNDLHNFVSNLKSMDKIDVMEFKELLDKINAKCKLTSIISINDDYIGGYELKIIDSNEEIIIGDVQFFDISNLKCFIKEGLIKNAILNEYTYNIISEDLPYKNIKTDEKLFYEYYMAFSNTQIPVKSVRLSNNFREELNSNWHPYLVLPQPLIRHDGKLVQSMKELFYNCNELHALDLSNFDTTQVTDMSQMFAKCNSLQKLDLSHFDTSKVTDMSGMFEQCKALHQLNLSNFNTFKVDNMRGMFAECKMLKRLELNHFNTAKVTDMSYMFAECSELEKVYVNNFNTSELINMSCMFFWCNKLKELNLSSFDTSNVIDMSCLFFGCNKLHRLNLSNFNTFKVTDMSCMFAECSELEQLDITNFDTSNVIYMGCMFKRCNKLQNLGFSKFK